MKKIKYRKLKIGILTLNIDESYQKSIWKMIEKAALRHNVDILTFMVGFIGTNSSLLINNNTAYELARKSNLDGYILFTSTFFNNINFSMINEFIESFRPHPIVSIGAKIKNAISILIDDEIGIKTIVNHLIHEHGRRKIAFIRGPVKNLDANKRFMKYKEALIENRIKIDENLIEHGGFFKSDGENAVSNFIDKKKAKFDAIVCANDEMAIGAIEELKKRCIKVPGDVSVVGYDNILKTRYIIPSLTTIEQNLDEIGYIALTSLINKINGEDVKDEYYLKEKIILRESCGCKITNDDNIEIVNNLMIDDKLDLQLKIKNALDINFANHNNYLINRSRIHLHVDRLIHILEKGITDRSAKIFLSTLEKLVFYSTRDAVNFSDWKMFLDIIYLNFVNNCESKTEIDLITIIFNHAEKIVLETYKKVLGFHNLSLYDYINYTYEISHDYISALSIDKLTNIMINELTHFNILNCIVYLIKKKDQDIILTSEFLRFINGEKQASESGEIPIPLQEIFEKYYYYTGKNTGSAFIIPLWGITESLGIVIFEKSKCEEVTYEHLAFKWSNAIQSIKYYNRMQEQAKILKDQVKLTREDLDKEKQKIKEYSETIDYQSTHDLLTGLYNRNKFEDLLHELIKKTCENNENHVLCYIDVDQFKLINDSSGSIAGDELLQKIAHYIDENIKDNDILSRFGDDHFGLIIKNTSIDKAIKKLKKIKKFINERKYNFKERKYTISISIGLTEINIKSKDTTSLIGASNIACNLAKKKGGNRIQVYHLENKELLEFHDEISYFPQIIHTLEENRFCLFRQKIININEEENFSYYEILIRMIDNNNNIILPAKFLGTAERYNIIQDIDMWVINNLFSMIHKKYKNNMNDFKDIYSINLSINSFNNESIIGFTNGQIMNYGIPAANITFELTETTALQNYSRVIYFINDLKKIGCKFALDNFGSGWTSFSYLKKIPVDFLKIDGAFVKSLDKDKRDYGLVQSIHTLGKILGFKTIAKYVENNEILKKLQEIGVNYAQGFYIEKPELLDITKI